MPNRPVYGHGDALELAHTYADIVNRQAWHELGHVVTPQVSVRLDLRDRAPLNLVGLDQLADFLADALRRFEAFQFVPLSVRVSSVGAGAGRSRMYIEERRHVAEGGTAGGRSVAKGVYHDSASFGPDGWRWNSRIYSSLARSEPWQLFGFPTEYDDFLSPGVPVP